MRSSRVERSREREEDFFSFFLVLDRALTHLPIVRKAVSVLPVLVKVFFKFVSS